MGRFRHVSNWIHVDDGVVEVDMTLSFFVTQEPLYTLPAPWTSRYYEQGVIHKLSNQKDVTGGPFPWSEGDSYIAKRAIYESAWDEFLNPPPTLEQAKVSKINELRSYSNGKKAGKVIYSSNTYLSVKNFLERIMHEYEKFDRVGSLPAGYYVLDHLDNEISFTVLANLEALIDRIIELHWECDKVEDNHRQSINALVSVESVQSYDFTTGWPTIPY